ncbi:MAG: alanyl-tRNA editing protein, partial [Clostridia bacterium]|nr:alanyl-tRNA editing protein [Clostridia bacterium]
ITLNRTAFFPGGGGQASDVGRLNNANVVDMRDEGAEIIHLTDAPLTIGDTVCGRLDPEVRLRRMQNHSGEHILSGLFHREHGLTNVGFHMGSEDVTLDLDGELTREQIAEIESKANHIIAENLPITVFYPSPAELQTLAYRSKLDLTEGVRIVSIGENGMVDRCACCAPHFGTTGQIGIIKILDVIRYKGGLRLHILCGLDALDDYRLRYASVAEIAASLSVKQQDAAAAVARINDELTAEKGREAALRRRLCELHTAAIPDGAPYALMLEPTFAPGELRHLVNAALAHTAAAIACTGSDAEGYSYVLGTSSLPLRTVCAEMHAALGGRGGGSDAMVQGKLPCDILTLRAWLDQRLH